MTKRKENMKDNGEKNKKQLVEEVVELRQKETELQKVKRKHEKMEKELLRVNRALETISASHEVLVRASNKAELLSEICRVVVQVGGYSLGWVGIASHDRKKTVRVVAHAGDTERYLEKIKVTYADDKYSQYPAGIAVRTGKQCLVKNIVTDPNFLSWRGEALKHGFTSTIALPLIQNCKPFGALSIYSKERDAFNIKEVELLHELADNLVYGIVALHNRIERNRAEKEVKNNVVKLRQALGAIIKVLESTVEIKDPYTAGHQRRVADLARRIAKDLGLSPDRIDGIRIAGIIHDVGKMHVPSEILSKPDRLSEIEFSLIKTHPQVGFDILKEIEFPWPVADIVLQHHERMDGSGYPNKLSNENILLEARILAVADVVEAMTSHRPYRPALGIQRALEEISTNRGILYDPEVVDVCLKLFKEGKYKFQ